MPFIQSKIESDGSKQISSLLNALESGYLRVPRFQRDFVWERSKIIDLLDSIYKEYPIGSFFLWETSGVISTSGVDKIVETI